MVTKPGHAAPPARWARAALIVVDLVAAVSSIAGGLGLFFGWISMPLDQLDGTPFASYTGPGLILLLAVGSSALVATDLMIAEHARGIVASGVAGGVMMGWIIGEFILLGYISWLQPFMFGLGAVMFALAAWLYAMGTHRAGS